MVSRLDAAEDQIRGAIDELRELAHGIYPAVLADEGLTAAVEALSERSSIPVRIAGLVDERFPRAVEAAAYFVIAEASDTIAASIGASAVTVALQRKDGSLLVEVTEEGAREPTPEVQPVLTELSDRVGALNGQLTAEHVRGRGFTIRAEIPCES